MTYKELIIYLINAKSSEYHPNFGCIVASLQRLYTSYKQALDEYRQTNRSQQNEKGNINHTVNSSYYFDFVNLSSDSCENWLHG